MGSTSVTIATVIAAAGFEPLLLMDLADVSDSWGLLEPVANTVVRVAPARGVGSSSSSGAKCGGGSKGSRAGVAGGRARQATEKPHDSTI